jgi:mRNA interferase HigB
MRRIVTLNRLRTYAADFPETEAALYHWERITKHAQWHSPDDVKQSFNDVDRVRVKSGRSVYIFNIQHNKHRLIAAIHFDTGIVYVLRLLTHQAYSRGRWRDGL